ncbi:MAG: hypothetical protein SF162_11875 [bacterium]|nr:hypothetical protein [bacterium]
MIPLPRIMTVDPSGVAARLVRAAVDLLHRAAIQFDVPSSLDALDEVARTSLDVVIVSLDLDQSMQGFDFALRVKQERPEISVIVIAGEADADLLDEETRAASPFLFVRHPMDAELLLRAIAAGLDGRDVLTAQFEPAARAAEHSHADIGAVPTIDVKAATTFVDQVLTDVGAMAVVLCNRAGDVLLERGAVGYIDRDQLTSALLPSVMTTFEMSKLVGGKAAALSYFDGDRFDVYVLSVGLHHMLTVIFESNNAARGQLGAVSRFGRRAAEDLVALIGASAFMVEAEREARATMEMRRAAEIAQQAAQDAPPPLPEEKKRGRGRKTSEVAALDSTRPNAEPLILRSDEIEAVVLPEPEPLRLEPIADLDLDKLDPGLLNGFDLSAADDLFDMEKLAGLANETRRERGPLSYDEARELGIIP